MPRTILFALFLCLPALAAAETLSLDGAIEAAASAVRESVPGRSTVAVVSVTAPTAGLSDYITEELNGSLVNGGDLADGGSLVVIERKDLDLVRGELRFQTSGDVDDESAQSVGRLLGASVIVTGALDASYRLRVKAISVETGRILAVSSVDVERTGKAGFLGGIPGAELPAYGFDDPGCWSAFTDSSGSGGTNALVSVGQERIEGKDYTVVTVEAEIPSPFRYSYACWVAIPDEATIGKLRATKGVRFKVVGDGKNYTLRVHTAGVTDDDWFSCVFATKKGQVVDVAIPYKKLRQTMQKGARFDRSTITGLSFLTRKSTSTPIKFFDIRPY